MSTPFTVVLAEDDRPLRALMRILLEETGRVKIVGEAEEGREAVVVSTRVQPEFILLDLSMPGMDGRSALPILRKEIPDSKVICISMLQRHGVEEEVMGMGAVAFVDKGDESDAFVRQLLSVMERLRGPPPGETDETARHPRRRVAPTRTPT